MLKWPHAWGCIDGAIVLWTQCCLNMPVSPMASCQFGTQAKETGSMYPSIKGRHSSTETLSTETKKCSPPLWDCGRKESCLQRRKTEWCHYEWCHYEWSIKYHRKAKFLIFICFNLQQFCTVSLNASAVCFHDIFLVLFPLPIFINQIIHLYPLASAMIANPTRSQNGYKVKLF